MQITICHSCYVPVSMSILKFHHFLPRPPPYMHILPSTRRSTVSGRDIYYYFQANNTHHVSTIAKFSCIRFLACQSFRNCINTFEFLGFVRNYFPIIIIYFHEQKFSAGGIYVSASCNCRTWFYLISHNGSSSTSLIQIQ